MGKYLALVTDPLKRTIMRSIFLNVMVSKKLSTIETPLSMS